MSIAPSEEKKMSARSGKSMRTRRWVRAGKLLKTGEDSLTYLAAILLGMLVIAIVLGIGSRLSGIRVSGIIEISSFILIALVFLPLSEVTRSKQHVRVQFINDRFSPRVKKHVEIITSILALFVVTIISVLCWQMFIETLRSRSVTVGSPHISLWIPQLPIALGMSLTGIRMVLDLIITIWIGDN